MGHSEKTRLAVKRFGERSPGFPLLKPISRVWGEVLYENEVTPD